MSRAAFQLLRQVGLLDQNDRAVDLNGFDDAALRDKLNFYFQSRAAGAEGEVASERVGAREFAALRSSISCRSGMDAILPSALVYHRFFIDDPLFCLATPRSQASRALNEYLGCKPDEPIDRDRIGRILGRFQSLAPLVSGGFCSILPIGLLHRVPDETPVYASEDGFNSALSEGVREFIRTAAHVREVSPLPGGALAISPEPPKSPTRGIHIGFSGDGEFLPGLTYLLFDIKPVGGYAGGKMTIAHHLDWDKKPSQAQYNAWVAQSINRVAISRLSGISSELSLADGLGATYVTESEFESRLLGLDSGAAPRSRRANAVNFLTANAPFVNVNSPAQVAALRQDHPILFEKFQASLLHVSSQLTDADEDYEEKARALYVKEIEPQVRDLNTQFSKYVWQGVSSGIMATAATISLALTKGAAVPLSVPLVLAFAGLAAFQGLSGALPSRAEYKQKKLGPAYIWSQLAPK